MIDRNRSLFVDLDSTLAMPTKGPSFPIGEPNPKVAARVMNEIRNGRDVVLFTARSTDGTQIPVIKNWLADNGFPDLRITNIKDQTAGEIWDDKAVGIDPRTMDLAVGSAPEADAPSGDVALEVAIKLGKTQSHGGSCGCGKCGQGSSSAPVGILRGAFADTQVQKRKRVEAKANFKELQKAKAGKPTEPVVDAPLVKYVAKHDKRARPEHAKLDGKIMPADSLAAKSVTPPADKNCRCEVEPLMKTSKPVTKKEEKDYYHQVTAAMADIRAFADSESLMIGGGTFGGGTKVLIPVMDLPDFKTTAEFILKDSKDNVEVMTRLNNYLVKAKSKEDEIRSFFKIMESQGTGDQAKETFKLAAAKAGTRLIEATNKRLEAASYIAQHKDTLKKANRESERKNARSDKVIDQKIVPSRNAALADIRKLKLESAYIADSGLVDSIVADFDNADKKSSPDASDFTKVSVAASSIIGQARVEKQRRKDEAKAALSGNSVKELQEAFAKLDPSDKAEFLLENPGVGKHLGETFGGALLKSGIKPFQQEAVMTEMSGKSKLAPAMVGIKIQEIKKANSDLETALKSADIEPASISDEAWQILVSKPPAEAVREHQRRLSEMLVKADRAKATAKSLGVEDLDPTRLDVYVRKGVESNYKRDKLISDAAELKNRAETIATGKVQSTKLGQADRDKQAAYFKNKANELLSKANERIDSPDEAAFKISKEMDKKAKIDALRIALDNIGRGMQAEEAYSLGMDPARAVEYYTPKTPEEETAKDEFADAGEGTDKTA